MPVREIVTRRVRHFGCLVRICKLAALAFEKDVAKLSCCAGKMASSPIELCIRSKFGATSA